MDGETDKRVPGRFGDVRSTGSGVAEQALWPEGPQALPAEPPCDYNRFHGSSKWRILYRLYDNVRFWT